MQIRTPLIEELLRVSTLVNEIHRDVAEQFDDVRQMILVATELRGLFRVEQEIAGGQFERHAGGAPDVARRSVFGAQQHLQASVLSRLDVVGEVSILNERRVDD